MLFFTFVAVNFSVSATARIGLIWGIIQSNLPFIPALKKRAVREFFRLLKMIPYVHRKIEKEMSKARQEIQEGMEKAVAGTLYVQRLPKQGLSEVITLLLCLSSQHSHSLRHAYLCRGMHTGHTEYFIHTI